MRFILHTAHMPENSTREVYSKRFFKLFTVMNEEYTENTTDPLNWGIHTIRWFNSTCRPGERKRVFLGVTILDNNGHLAHKWVKSCLVTQNGKGGMHDTMKCENCGITGKRYGLGPNVTHDLKFDKEKYRYCNPL